MVRYIGANYLTQFLLLWPFRRIFLYNASIHNSGAEDIITKRANFTPSMTKGSLGWFVIAKHVDVIKIKRKIFECYCS